jgi:Na+-translocating ferredoxin:NAD+ oxidoreductase subunit B
LHVVLNIQNTSSVSIDALEALLPQTQCRQCGYPGCRPYAEALFTGSAPVDRCKPGGVPVMNALNQRLNNTSAPIPTETSSPPALPPAEVAWIDESQCIGCALCLVVCPVDAIIGTSQWMHTIITQDCTGCALCVAPCPVECIHIQPHPSPDPISGYAIAPERARQAFLQQQARRTAEQQQKAERLLALYQPIQTVTMTQPPQVPQEERRAFIDQLRTRAKQRRKDNES